MQLSPSLWPPTYNLRFSQRARRVNLKFCPTNGLEIVVPNKFNVQRIPNIIEQHRGWIERTQQKLKNIAKDRTEELLPITINLAALNQIWQVNYESTAASVLHLKQIDTHQLLIVGNLQNQTAIKKLLHKWLKRLAKNHLIPLLNNLSQLHNLPFTKVSIRYSQTHWGSCTAKKNISLSSQLMLILPELVEHVLLHELCHTKVLNHSKNFWSLFASANPDCHNLRKRLRIAQHNLPRWVIEK